MGVTLKISKPLNREYFTSAETVCGDVELTACRTSLISSITVFLEGTYDYLQNPIRAHHIYRKATHGCTTALELPGRFVSEK